MENNINMSGNPRQLIKQPPIIIAECGNNHGGDFDVACELLNYAKHAGADLVKFQAGTGEGFAREEKEIRRYRKLELGLSNYKKLIQLGKDIGIPVFFSIWGQGFEELRRLQQYHKIPARQWDKGHIMKSNNENTFISISRGSGSVFYNNLKATVLHVVSEYPAYDPKLSRIQLLKKIFHNVGYSDHTVGISTCITAVKDFGAVAIEKHFTLPELKKESNFRDHIHSAIPKDFRIMVDILKGG